MKLYEHDFEGYNEIGAHYFGTEWFITDDNNRVMYHRPGHSLDFEFYYEKIKGKKFIMEFDSSYKFIGEASFDEVLGLLFEKSSTELEFIE